MLIYLSILLPANSGDIIITELFHEKTSGTLPEYVELYNRTDSVINLHGWSMKVGSDTINIQEVSQPSLYKAFNIKPKDYVVIMTDGQFRSQNGTTYCSANNYHYIYNNCTEDSTSQIFWKLGAFPGLSSVSDTIIIIDNFGKNIDLIKYNSNSNIFPINSDSEGKGHSAELIIDPMTLSADSLNDFGNNWRLSHQLSDTLWNGNSKDYGSPLSPSFIKPQISYSPNLNSNSDSTKNSKCYEENLTITCKPRSDGYPGGYLALKLLVSSLDSKDLSVKLDSLFIELKKGSALIDGTGSLQYSGSDSLKWEPNPIYQDTSLASQIFNIYTFARSQDYKQFGKKEEILYIKQEDNERPQIQKMNNKDNPAIIYVEENSITDLYATITDAELCSNLNEPCSLDSLKFNSSWYDNSSPFLWTGDSIQFLSDINILSTKFTSTSIDSINGVSANNNPDTLLYKFKATDPFGLFSEDSITIVVQNRNRAPKLEILVSDQFIFEDDSLIIELQGSDPDGDDLIYGASSNSNANIIINATKIIIYPKVNFNGTISITTFVKDDNTEISLKDEHSFILNVRPVNDKPDLFSIDTDLFSYNINSFDTTSSYLDSTSIMYFRLPQNSYSISDSIASLLKFKWEKNDSLDVDIIPTLNLYQQLSLFYRLEAIISDAALNDSIYIILNDSINHDDFIGDSIYANVSIIDSFFNYSNYGAYVDHIDNEKLVLDLKGNTIYKWRVIAQNYSSDINYAYNDPFRISSGWEDSHFKIDLTPPEIYFLDIIINKNFPKYFDLIWSASEPLLTDYSFLSIKEQNNKFSSKTMLNPRKTGSSAYHYTGIFPSSVNSANMIFDLKLRDHAMNSGARLDTVTYLSLSPDSSITLLSNSKYVELIFPQKSVLEHSNILLFEENVHYLIRQSIETENKIGAKISLYPLDISLNQEVQINFNLNDDLIFSVDPLKLVICKTLNSSLEPLPTFYANGKLSAKIKSFGSYAIYLDEKSKYIKPVGFEIGMNYPNPFNSSTIIPIIIPNEGLIKVSIYNILGKKVDVLFEGIKSSGSYSFKWDGIDHLGNSMSSGIYFINIQFQNKVYSQKLILLK